MEYPKSISLASWMKGQASEIHISLASGELHVIMNKLIVSTALPMLSFWAATHSSAQTMARAVPLMWQVFGMGQSLVLPCRRRLQPNAIFCLR